MNSASRPNEPVKITDRHTYRKVSWLERIGTTVADQIKGGWLRDLLRAVYRQILWLKTRGKGIRCDFPSGEQLRLRPEHRPAWNPVECAGFKAAIRPGSIVLDIGANIGTYSLLFGQWVGPNGKVYAFEPAPESFAALSQHIVLNALENVVIPIRQAVSDRVGALPFVAKGTHGTNRLISASETWTSDAVEQMETVTIDEFCASRGLKPDVIKIDIEGFELAALRGAETTLRACREKLTVFVEMHPTTWKVLGLTREDIEKELGRQGYVAEPLVPAENDPWEVEGVCMRLSAVPAKTID